jgi:hypothetical protein
VFIIMALKKKKAITCGADDGLGSSLVLRLLHHPPALVGARIVMAVMAVEIVGVMTDCGAGVTGNA